MKTNDNNTSNVKIYKEKVASILSNIRVLFAPFTEVILGIFPRSKILINAISKSFALVEKVIIFSVDFYVFLIHAIRSKIVLFFVILLFVLFVSNTILNRSINQDYYKFLVESAVFESTGYKIKIDGTLKVNFLPYPMMRIEKVKLINKSIQNSKNLSVEQIAANQVSVNFSIWNFLLGRILVKDITLYTGYVKLYAPFIQEDSKNINNIINYVQSNLNASHVNMPVESNITKKQATGIKNRAAFKDYYEMENLMNRSLTDLNKDNNLDTFKSRLHGLSQEVQLDLSGVLSNFQEMHDFETKQKGLIYSIAHYFSSHFTLDLSKVEKVYLSNSSFLISNKRNLDSFSMKRIDLEIQDLNSSNYTVNGHFMLLDKLIYFRLHNKQDSKEGYSGLLELDLSSHSFKNNYTKILINIPDTNKPYITGSIKLDAQMIHQVLSKLIVDLNVGDSAVLEANYKIEDGYFISQNIKVIDDKRRYLSSLRLDLGDSHNIDVTINLQDYDVNTFNLSSYTSSSNNIIDNLFQDLVHFKSSELSAIQPKNIHLILNIKNGRYKNKLINSLNSEMVLNNNTVYVKHLLFKAPNINIVAFGKANFINKSMQMGLKSDSSTKALLEFIDSDAILQKFMYNLFEGDRLLLNTNLIYSNNKVFFNNISGMIGNQSLKDIRRASYTFRSGVSDLNINIHANEIDLLPWHNKYKKQIELSNQYANIMSKSFTGINDKLDVSLTVSADKVKYHEIQLYNLSSHLTLGNTSLNIVDFYAKDKKTGYIKGSFSIDKKVQPSVVSNINASNLTIRGEDLRGIIAQDANIKGTFIVNSNIDITGETVNTKLVQLDGTINIVTKQRYLSKEKLDTQGVYVTLKRSKKDSKAVIVKDLLLNGRLRSGVLNIYPIMIVYNTLNNKEYRGNVQGEINFLDDRISLNGVLENIKNSNKVLAIDLDGNLLNMNANLKIKQNAELRNKYNIK